VISIDGRSFDLHEIGAGLAQFIIVFANAAAPRAGRSGRAPTLVPAKAGMGRPSLIDLEADLAAGALTAVRVGGTAVLIGRGSLDLP
jgi:predicted PhzF superfamily epimerase YddE/YHI9